MGWLDRLRGRTDPPPPPGPLADLAAAPVVARTTPLAQVELVAMDLETTGLDPRQHELLSFGLVPVRGGEVLLGGALHRPVRPRGEVGDSAVVHGLTDDALATAPPLADVLPEVLAAFSGRTTSPAPSPDRTSGSAGPDASQCRTGRVAVPDRTSGSAGPDASQCSTGHTDGRGTAYPRRVLVAHFAQVETTFLAAACWATYGSAVGLQVVDTMEVARRLIGAQHHELRPGQLRLDACRRRYGLPRYRAHSAVVDALACAELFLAQCAELEERRGRPLTLADVAESGLHSSHIGHPFLV